MFARQIFVSPNKVIPAQGTVVRIYANGPQAGESWSFSSSSNAAGLLRVIDDEICILGVTLAEQPEDDEEPPPEG